MTGHYVVRARRGGHVVEINDQQIETVSSMQDPDAYILCYGPPRESPLQFGLERYGNTCYLSAMQTLTSIVIGSPIAADLGERRGVQRECETRKAISLPPLRKNRSWIHRHWQCENGA